MIIFWQMMKFLTAKQERILDVVSRWPGSAHDSMIFAHSNLCMQLRNDRFGNDLIIVVDSAYPPERYICKPLAATNTPNEDSYQHCQIKARNVAERVNGQLKREFPILKHGNFLSLKLKFVLIGKIHLIGMRFKKRGTGEAVVVCCCILHNMRKVAK